MILAADAGIPRRTAGAHA